MVGFLLYHGRQPLQEHVDVVHAPPDEHEGLHGGQATTRGVLKSTELVDEEGKVVTNRVFGVADVEEGKESGQVVVDFGELGKVGRREGRDGVA